MHKTSARLLALLSLLQTPRDWSGDDLAERLGITSRTVRRDIDRLRELDYPIKTLKGPVSGYRLEASADAPAAHAVRRQPGRRSGRRAADRGRLNTAIAEDASRALATLRQVMPARLRRRIDLLHITAVQPPAAAGDTPRSTLRF